MWYLIVSIPNLCPLSALDDPLECTEGGGEGGGKGGGGAEG